MIRAETTTRLSGAELIVRCLEQNGVTHVFNLPGHGMGPLVKALDAHRGQIRYVSGVNETNVATIAEGYARATRKPAFVNVYHSSGTQLAMFAVSVAWADHTPLVLTTTADPVNLAGHDGYAAVPKAITQISEQYTKWSYEVPSVETLPWAIERALMIAATPPMGPVHLSFPMSLYEDEIDETKLRSRYARAQLFERTCPDEAGVERAAALLAAARSPLILAGGGIGQYDAIEELVAFAELLDAPVLRELGRPTYLPFPSRHRLFAGKYGHDHELVKNADVIVVAEFDVTESTAGESPLWDSQQSIIHLTVDPASVCKQFDPDIVLLAHPKSSIQKLASATARLLGSRRQESKDFTNERMGIQAGQVGAAGPTRVRGALVGELVGALRDEFGQKLTIADHAITGSPNARGTVPLSVEASDYRSKDDYFALSQKGSAQGWLLPAAIGIQLGLPDRQVVAALGDGNFMFTSSALYSAAKMRIPLIVVVVNNGGYGGGRMGGNIAPETNQGNFRDPAIDYCRIAEGMGVPAFKVSTAEDIPTGMNCLHERGRPFLFEVIE